MIEPVDLLALARALSGFGVPLVALAFTAWVAGRRLTEALGIRMEPALESAALATTVGLAALAHALLLLGLVGGLRCAPVLAIGALIHLGGLWCWRELGAAFRSWRAHHPPRQRAATIAIGLVVALPLVLPALYPDTGFDSRMYHLPYVHAFVAAGRMPFLGDLRFPIFPQASEVLSAALVLFGSDASAHGVGILVVALTAGLLVAWGKRAFPGWRASGPLAAAMLLGSPLVGYLASVLYVDPTLGLFTTAALYSAERFRDTGKRRWIPVAAALAATAADVKYLGLYAVGITALMIAIPRRGAAVPGRIEARDLVRLAIVSLAIVAPWYGRIALVTGNPVFPFFPSVFGAGPWTPVPEPAVPLVERLVRAARMPWDLAFARHRWNQMPPLSPIHLVTLPLVALALPRSRRLRWWAAVLGVYVLVYPWLPRSAAYVAMLLPLASLTAAGATGMVLGAWLETRRLVVPLVLVSLAPGWLYGVYTVARHGPLPVTEAARERYLDAKLPLHAAVAFLDRAHGHGYAVWAVDAEHMVDFADGRFLGDTSGRAGLAHAITGDTSVAELRHDLRRRGLDHLLVPTTSAAKLPLGDDPETARWFEREYADSSAIVYALR